jgi:pyruvate/2-oxoglutarate dehydrogenase complex dihydrolipoamide acyltransferase (E2) component
MATVVPGGAYLDSSGRPTDANGVRLDGLPSRLREEEKVALRDAGLVAQKQIDHFSAGQLQERFGLAEDFARFVKGEIGADEYRPGGDEEVEATDAAAELAEEAGIALSEIQGTGKDGRITKSDVQDALE